ncbi:MAG TPA: hypothetical protein VL137_17000 [Polyangiaceae bacterium]|nr:hypothetical protein [Polyangiaceae bacterium]
METRKLAITQKRLRDLANRALRAIERHKAHYGVAAAAATLEPAAQAYIKVYDEVARYREAQNEGMALGKRSLVELQDHLRAATAMLGNHVPTFDAQELQGSLETPDRLLSDAAKVLSVLGKVPQSEAFTSAIQTALQKASTQWTQAQTDRANLQQAQLVVRQSAIVFNRELIALRRLLRVIVGTHHVDYQALRATRANPEVIDEEDTTVVDDEPTDTASSAADVHNNGATSNGAPNPAPFTGATA